MASVTSDVASTRSIHSGWLYCLNCNLHGLAATSPRPEGYINVGVAGCIRRGGWLCRHFLVDKPCQAFQDIPLPYENTASKVNRV